MVSCHLNLTCEKPASAVCSSPAFTRGSRTSCRPAWLSMRTGSTPKDCARDDWAGAALRRPQLPASGGRRLRADYDARRRVRGGLDGPVAATAPAHAMTEGAHRSGSAAGCCCGCRRRLVQQQLPGQPRDLAAARALQRAVEAARVGLLHRARKGAAPAVRLLPPRRSPGCWPSSTSARAPRSSPAAPPASRHVPLDRLARQPGQPVGIRDPSRRHDAIAPSPRCSYPGCPPVTAALVSLRSRHTSKVRL